MLALAFAPGVLLFLFFYMRGQVPERIVVSTYRFAVDGSDSGHPISFLLSHAPALDRIAAW